MHFRDFYKKQANVQYRAFSEKISLHAHFNHADIDAKSKQVMSVIKTNLLD
jgi:hypothetical protein